MPLIGVRKVLIEELNPMTLDVLEDGERYESYCNTLANINPLWVGGQEEVYTNENRMVDQNVENISYYGADISLSVQQMGIPWFRFLNGGEIGTGSDEKYYGRNLVGSAWGSGYEADITRYPSGNLSGGTWNSYHTSAISGTLYSLNGNSAVINANSSCSVRPVLDDGSNDVAAWELQKKQFVEAGWPSGSNAGYRIGYDGRPTWNNFPQIVTGGTNVAYNSLAFYSYRSRIGGDANTGSTAVADIRATYNIVVPIELNQQQRSNFPALQCYQNGSFCVHITLNPEARERVVTGGANAANTQAFIENDEYMLYTGSVIDLVGTDFRFTDSQNDPPANVQAHKCFQFKAEYKYQEPQPIMVSVFYYLTSPLTADDISSANYFRTNGNYVQSFYFTHALVPSVTLAYVPYEEQVYSPSGYYDISDYYDDLEVAIAPASDLEAGQYKNPIGSRQNKRNAFKMTLWTDNVKGEDIASYVKMEFPFCYADPTAFTLNERFSEHPLIIHAREQYSNLRSFVYLKETDSLVDETEE